MIQIIIFFHLSKIWLDKPTRYSSTAYNSITRHQIFENNFGSRSHILLFFPSKKFTKWNNCFWPYFRLQILLQDCPMSSRCLLFIGRFNTHITTLTGKTGRCRFHLDFHGMLEEFVKLTFAGIKPVWKKVRRSGWIKQTKKLGIGVP